MWKWLRMLWQDQRGQEEGAAAAGDASGDAGQGDAGEGALDNGQGAEGQAGDGSQAQPKFGEFGDDPNEAAVKLMEAYTKIKGEHQTFKQKAGLTERNLASLRQTLEGSGIRAIEDESGQIRLEVAQKEPRKTRFTDEHKALFEEPVLEAMRLLVQDMFDEQYEGRERTTQEKRQQMQQFMSEKAEVEELMLGYFPQLDPKDPNFNQAFFDRATEIWQDQYKGNLLKQLSAALRAAQELKIIPQMLNAAKKEGVKIGKDGKKILGPVGGAGAKGGGGAMRKLSREEYFALSEEKRQAYDQWEVEQRGK